VLIVKALLTSLFLIEDSPDIFACYPFMLGLYSEFPSPLLTSNFGYKNLGGTLKVPLHSVLLAWSFLRWFLDFWKK
jgi:hypothetical protein